MQKQAVTDSIKIKNNKLEILKNYFPEFFDKNGEFNLEKFKNDLEEKGLRFSKETYSLDWLGKSYARILAYEPAQTLLKDDPKWNKKTQNLNSENILIKGDNLEVLKHLVNAYYEKIKMIYIDPPYNTGNDGFVYNDNRHYTLNQLTDLGIEEERAKRILEFVNSKSNSHSAWLTFMFPRLYIARMLLKDDGVIFVSIDDNEQAQLRLLMDEIFGEENFVATFKWNKTSTPPSLSKKLRQKYEYVICYEKKNNGKIFSAGNIQGGDMPLLNEANKISVLEIPSDKVIFNFDGFFQKGPYDRIELLEDLTIKDGKAQNTTIKLKGRFKWQQNNLDKEIQNGTKFIIKSPKFAIRYIKNGIRIKKPADIISKTECNVGTNEEANKEIIELFNFNIFLYPKPTSLIKYLINMVCDQDDLILDFFAGSGTTGDAVMQLNAQDGGRRKFILVQLPEPIDEKSNKVSYDFVKNELGVYNPTIFEITKERLVRAAQKIKEEKIHPKIEEIQKQIEELNKKLDLKENQELKSKLEQEITALQNQDLGFKIFETMPIWEEYLIDEKVLNEQTQVFDRVMFEEELKALLLTWKTFDGIPLTEECHEIDLDGYKAYYCSENLYLLSAEWRTANLKALIEKIDNDPNFALRKITAFGYNLTSKALREIEENIRNYANKKEVEIDVILRF